MLLIQTVHIPAAGVEAFEAFEREVLPLLPRHGGVLERRLKTDDGCIEVHIVSFPSHEALESYLVDPDRRRHLHLLHTSGAVAELLEVADA